MAAGLYLHILDDVDEQLVGSLNAPTQAPFLVLGATSPGGVPEAVTARFGEEPNVFLGEGAWAADGVAADTLPAPLARIRDNVASGPSVVDDDYIARIMIPFDHHHVTPYRLGRPGEIWRFLRHHEGKHALLAIHPEEVAQAAEPDAVKEPNEAAGAAAEPAPEPPLEPLEPVAHDPAFRRPIPTIDGVRPLALVLVTTQQRAPGRASLRERILAALATIGTFGAGLAAGAGLNTLIR